jgi:hypothetical protein
MRPSRAIGHALLVVSALCWGCDEPREVVGYGEDEDGGIYPPDSSGSDDSGSDEECYGAYWVDSPCGSCAAVCDSPYHINYGNTVWCEELYPDACYCSGGICSGRSDTSPQCGEDNGCVETEWLPNCPRAECRPLEELCGGPINLGCGRGQYCEYAFGRCPDCGETDESVCPGEERAPFGYCRDRVAEPTCAPTGNICGCDGVTYPSDCARQAAGVPARYAGACQ